MKKSMNILIVDDNQVYRKALKMMLSRMLPDCEILEAIDGKQCLKQLAKRSFDIVIMDIQMPVMNGIMATKAAIEKYPKLKIIGISMFGSLEDIFLMKDAGASGFLSKGGDQEEMEKAIRIVLSGKKYFIELNHNFLI